MANNLMTSQADDRQLMRMQTDKFSLPNGCKTMATVEKRLHIHSGACAKAAFLLADPVLSTFGAASIQCFSNSSGST